MTQVDYYLLDVSHLPDAPALGPAEPGSDLGRYAWAALNLRLVERKVLLSARRCVGVV